MSIEPDAAAGDELVPDANMVFDHRSTISATPEQIWPWLTQLGKHRAGWYLPARLERLVPPGRTELRLRFRGQLRSVGLQRRTLAAIGGRVDWLTGALMVAGLRERVGGDAAPISAARGSPLAGPAPVPRPRHTA